MAQNTSRGQRPVQIRQTIICRFLVIELDIATGEGYKAVSLCLYKQINHRVAIEWFNLTILSNGNTNVDDGLTCTHIQCPQMQPLR